MKNSKKKDFDLQIDNGDLNNAIKEFVRRKDNSKSNLS